MLQHPSLSPCRQPRLLVCDEATSALDSSTEAGIMASLAELAAGRTAVFVAHRLSTIQVGVGAGATAVLVVHRLFTMQGQTAWGVSSGAALRAA